MDFEKSFRWSLRIYASIVLVGSLAHGLWPWFFPTYVELKGLTEIQWNTFFLFNWSLTLCLFFLAILSFVVSAARSLALRQLRAFSAMKIGFWICRLALEFIFPLQIPFVIIPSPSPFLKILIAIGIAVLALPEVRLQLRK